MKKTFFPLILSLLLLAACGEKDTICACIAAGDALNKKSSELLQGTPNEADQKQWNRLKAEKEKKCAEFKYMGGPEMKKRMEDCE